ncbi:MAG: HzsA-related protein [Pirellulaceae bacterium]
MRKRSRIGGDSEHHPRHLVAAFWLAGLLWNACGGASIEAAPPTTGLPGATQPREATVSGSELRKLIEEDWLKSLIEPLTTQSDAAGAVDGIKDGKYAFHTGGDASPWWQVDLGSVQSITRIVVYNRLDYAPGLHNADTLVILTSDDGRAWTQRYDNQGRHFGGVSGAPPLEVVFQEGALQARFVRLQIPSSQPIFFHLDEVEIYGSNDSSRNMALRQAADQSSLSPWSTAKIRRQSDFPTAACIANGRKLAAHLIECGVDVSSHLEALAQAEERLRALPGDASEAQRRRCYLETRWAVRQLAFANPQLDFDQLLFVKRFTQEAYPDVCLNHMPWVSKPGGDLCVLRAAGPDGGLFRAVADPAEEEGTSSALGLTSLLNGALGPGHVHGMDLFWDGTRIVFGYAMARSDQPPEGWLDRSQSYRLRRTEEPTHLFEVGVDGRGLRQLTFGEWSDLDPTYAPSGDIVFVSERCGTSLQCNEYDKDETSCNLYVMRPDGSKIRRLSVNKDGDYLPHTLDNGLIAYTRWEYHERSWAYIQSIWTVRPDGTGADAIFKQHFVDPWALEDTRSIPHSAKLVAIAAGHHTLAVGPLVIVDTASGINTPQGIGIVTLGVSPPEGGMDGVPVPEGGVQDNGGFYSTPWALSDKFFLVSYTHGDRSTDPVGYGLYLVDVFGNKELIYRDAAISCFVPVPLRPRKTPPVLPETIDPTIDYASCVVSDVSFGCEDLAPERIRYLRVAEPIGWPYDNQLGGQRYGEKGPTLINWTPVRILGDIPVEPDGSAHFRVPPDTAVYFQLLDENRMELRRMRSFVSFQPGEQRACTGCHESRGVAPRFTPEPLAAALPPPTPLPPPWGNRPVSFLRDIQPILDRHCVECHSGLKPAGGLDFFGGLTEWSSQYEAVWGAVPGYGFNRAFETINQAQLVAIAEPNLQDASITPVLAYGAHKSKLFKMLTQAPHTERVTLSQDERLRLTMWMDANAPYHDAFVNKRPEKPAYDLAQDDELLNGLRALHEQRCAGCHASEIVSRLDWIDIHQADRSLFLRAPLAESSGGTQKCGQAVYANDDDPHYQAVRTLVEDALDRAWANPRRDLQALIRSVQTVSATEAPAR